MKTGRWPQGTRAFLILSAIFLVLLPISPFQPLGWPLAALSANLASKTYDGDAVIVRVDISGSELLGGRESALPRAIETVAEAGPDSIFVDHLPLSALTEEGSQELAQSISESTDKPTFAVTVLPSRNYTFRDFLQTEREQMKFNASLPHETLRKYITIANNRLDSNLFGAPIDIPAQLVTNVGIMPSLPQLLANDTTPIPANLPIDQRYDMASVPSYSLGDIIAGKIDGEVLRGKKVLLAATGDPRRDTLPAAGGQATSRAAITVIAAETISDGVPHNSGLAPGFILAMLAAIAWLRLPRPTGRLIALTTLVTLLALPFVLPGWGIYANPAHGIAFLAVFAVLRVVGRYRSAMNEAQRAAESKSWFLAQASHDLRQPIHAIGLLSERLAQTDLSSFQKDLVRKIGRSVEGSSRMFKSLLDVAALENGSLSAQPKPVSVNEILAEVEETQGIAAERSGFDLRLVPSEKIIMADRALTVTLLQNLVSNSIKYASGKKAVVGARPEGGTISLCVYDVGEGINSSDLRQVSREFYRASSRTPIEGSGLGLAIVDRICDLMGLRFRIRSRPGFGTSAIISGFQVTVDRLDHMKPNGETGSPLLQGLKVLILDDDLDTLTATDLIIRQWGCDTRTGTEFPERVDCDVIISDFDFGKGQTLADQGSRLGWLRAKGINTIVLSGHPPEIVREQLGEQAFLVLSKPLKPVELRAALLSSRVQQRV